MKEVKCIIVEDEIRYSNLLETLLKNTGYPIKVEQVCENVADGLAAINNYQPDLVFLDIWLHGNEKGGFELLYQFRDIRFDVIFTTAHIDDNIIEIRRCGLDRLLKPYVQKEIDEAIGRYFSRLDRAWLPQRIETLKANLLQKSDQDRIVYASIGGSEFPIKIMDIIYFTFLEPKLSMLFYSNNVQLISMTKRKECKEYLILHPDRIKPNGYECIEFKQQTTMKKAKEDFESLQFCSVHKSCLVNIHHVIEFSSRRTREDEVLMSDGEILAASKEGRSNFYKMTGKSNFRLK
jgi:two-component system LytT family response regulator